MTKTVDARDWIKSQSYDRRLAHEERIYGPREPMPPKGRPVEPIRLTEACKIEIRAAKAKSGLSEMAIARHCDTTTTYVHAAVAKDGTYCSRRRIPRKVAEDICRLFHVKMEVV